MDIFKLIEIYKNADDVLLEEFKEYFWEEAKFQASLKRNSLALDCTDKSILINGDKEVNKQKVLTWLALQGFAVEDQTKYYETGFFTKAKSHFYYTIVKW